MIPLYLIMAECLHPLECERGTPGHGHTLTVRHGEFTQEFPFESLELPTLEELGLRITEWVRDIHAVLGEHSVGV